MDEFAHERLKATPNWEAFSEAADSEYDKVVHQATKEMKELESAGADDEDAADRKAWEKVLPAKVEARFRDFDFAHYDISIPSRPATPASSPIAVVPLFPRTSPSPASPATQRDEGSTPVEEEELDPLFSMGELLGEE